MALAIPKLSMPKPKINMPKIQAPKINIPQIKLPSLPVIDKAKFQQATANAKATILQSAPIKAVANVAKTVVNATPVGMGVNIVKGLSQGQNLSTAFKGAAQKNVVLQAGVKAGQTIATGAKNFGASIGQGVKNIGASIGQGVKNLNPLNAFGNLREKLKNIGVVFRSKPFLIGIAITLIGGVLVAMLPVGKKYGLILLAGGLATSIISGVIAVKAASSQ
jgi:hypothetical protein